MLYISSKWMEARLLDFSAIFCDEHPDEKIINYCFNCTWSLTVANCMVPLCSHCICTHTETHVEDKTNPEYQSLKDIHTKFHRKLYQYISSLEKQRLKVVIIS